MAEAALGLRLLGAAVVVFIAPGFALVNRLHVDTDWPERLVLSFAISYSWVFGLAVLLPLAGWTADHAIVITAIAIGVLIASRWKTISHRAPTTSRSIGLAELVLVLAIAACSVAGWIIEPPITGEEALELASMSRFADADPITLENSSLLPATRPVYLFQPYQLALGMTARISRVDPLVALVKIRPLLVLLALTSVLALLRRLSPTTTHAHAAFAVVLAFVMLDAATWEANSLFPFVRRGGFSAGVCIPALMTLMYAATRRISGDRERVQRRLALGLMGSLSVATLATHPLEMFTFLAFAGAVVAATLIGFDRSGDRWSAVIAGAVLAVSVGGFLFVHARAVPEIAQFESEQKAPVRAELAKLSEHPRALLFGEMREEGQDLLAGDLPETTAGVVGIRALVLAALIAPGAAAILALGTIPLLMAYAMPGGTLVLAILTSPDTVQDVTAYFALLGLLAVGLGLAAVADLVLEPATRSSGSIRTRAFAASAAALILLATWKWAAVAIERVVAGAKSQPGMFVMTAGILALAVLVIAAWRRSIEVKPLPALIGPAFAAALAVPLALAPTTEKETLLARLAHARQSPSVVDWPAYYEVLRTTIRPALPVPRSVVDELKTKLPPRQVLLADPRYSCGLVVLLDAYCVNPESIYGHYFLSARPYQQHYVHSIDGQEGDWHPFFNSIWPPRDEERTVLTEYAVGYLLADPMHAALVERKLRELKIDATREMDRDGYVLYRLKR